jgi:rhodanese-related sulfurtransferase
MPRDQTQGNAHMPTTPVEPPVLGSEQLRSLLEQGAGWTVLDVRPTEERAEWFIPGSIHVDAYDALRAGDASALLSLDLPGQGPIVTVCARGRTSAIAARILREHGFDAYSLAGGMKAWSMIWNTAELASAEATLVQLRRTGKG